MLSLKQHELTTTIQMGGGWVFQYFNIKLGGQQHCGDGHELRAGMQLWRQRGAVLATAGQPTTAGTTPS